MSQDHQIPAIPSLTQPMPQEIAYVTQTMADLFYSMAKTMSLLGDKIHTLESQVQQLRDMSFNGDDDIEQQIDERVEHYLAYNFTLDDYDIEDKVRSHVEDVINGASISINI